MTSDEAVLVSLYYASPPHQQKAQSYSNYWFRGRTCVKSKIYVKSEVSPDLVRLPVDVVVVFIRASYTALTSENIDCSLSF